MFKKIALDHCWNEDQNFAYFKKLGKLGFNLEADTVEHPGKAFCKFIALQSGNKRQRFYLEFVHVGEGGVFEKVPGLSFNYSQNLERFFDKISKKIKSSFVHKNYNWKENSVDRLPGWNMLNFKKQPLQNIYTWFTEFEDSEVQKKLKKVKIHPNSTYSVHGINLTISPKSKKNLEIILCKKLSEVNLMGDGSFLYLNFGKKDSFDTIILNCKSFKKMSKFIKNPVLVKFQDLDAIKITNISTNKKDMWDLLIIEN